MLNDLIPKHSFAVQAWFESSMVLSFAFPAEQLQALLPNCLKVDTWQNQYGFVAVAMVKTKGLRPKGFPTFLGNDFYLAGYRIFVRYQNEKDKNLRGLYILRSETDKLKMKILGNLLTQYKYHKTDIQFTENDNNIIVKSVAGKLDVEILKTENPKLPTGSLFADWKEARRFAGPLPFTFGLIKGGKKIMIIQGLRENWEPQPLQVTKAHIGFIHDNPAFKNGILANAFVVKNIPYEWKKGITEEIRY